MISFLALYRGPSLERAELVAVSADPELIAHVAGALLKEKSDSRPTLDDAAIEALSRGRRKALRIIHGEARGGSRGKA
jgi:hypothetical protein